MSKLLNTLGAGTAAAAIVAAPINDALAKADQVFDLRSTTAPETLVEWQGARGTNIVRAQIDGTRRNLTVFATTNSPVFLDGACPSPSAYPGWGVVTGKALADTSAAGSDPTKTDHAELDFTHVERTGNTGTWTLRGTAPARPGQTIKSKIACAHGTGEDAQKEDLTFAVTAVGSGPIAAPVATVFDESEENGGSKRKGIPVKIRLHGGDDYTLSTKAHCAAFGGAVSMSPLANTFELGADITILPKITDAATIDGTVRKFQNVAGDFTVYGGINPIIAKSTRGQINAVLDLAVGIGRTGTADEPGFTVSAQTRGIAKVRAGVEAGNDDLRFGAAVVCTGSTQSAFERCGGEISGAFVWH